MCPGCKIEMRIVSTEAKSDGLATVTYRCDQCGTETQRTFKSSSKL